MSFGKAQGWVLCRCLFISRLRSPKQLASSWELHLSSPREVTFSDSELERKPSGLQKETWWAAGWVRELGFPTQQHVTLQR